VVGFMIIWGIGLMECCKYCNQDVGTHFYRDEKEEAYHFLCAEKKFGIKFKFNYDKYIMEIKK
jgi:hypothetical protein